MAEFQLEFEVFEPYNNMVGTLTPGDQVTAELVISLANSIYNASSPVGMGFLHAKDGGLSEADQEVVLQDWNEEHELKMDYVHGRQCKFDLTPKYNYATQQKEHGKMKIFLGDKPQPVEMLVDFFQKAGHTLTVTAKKKEEAQV